MNSLDLIAIHPQTKPSHSDEYRQQATPRIDAVKEILGKRNVFCIDSIPEDRQDSLKMHIFETNVANFMDASEATGVMTDYDNDCFGQYLYMISNVMQKFSNREYKFLTSNQVMELFENDFSDSFVLKKMGFQKGLPVFRIKDKYLFDETKEALLGILGDGEDKYVFQDYVEMQYESRFFVVRNNIVSGAGQVEKLLPKDITDTELYRFDNKVERKRNSGKITEMEIERTYVPTIQSIISDITKEYGGKYHTYTIDMCMIDNKPSIVEFNPIGRSGLFCHDFRTIVLAVVEDIRKNQGKYSNRPKNPLFVF